jgi:predicted DNA-binding ribbon-helix-helix protein
MPKITDKPLNHIISTRLSNKDYKQLVNTAKLHKLTITSLIRKLVREYVDKLNRKIPELN